VVDRKYNKEIFKEDLIKSIFISYIMISAYAIYYYIESDIVYFIILLFMKFLVMMYALFATINSRADFTYFGLLNLDFIVATLITIIVK